MASLHGRCRTTLFFRSEGTFERVCCVIIHDTDLDVRAADVDADEERCDRLIARNPFTSHDIVTGEEWLM